MNSQPSSPPERPSADRSRACRPVLAGATLLMTAQILAGCLFPGMDTRPTVAEPPPPAVVAKPAPDVEPPPPVTETRTEPKPVEPAKPLPPIAEGEPTAFIVNADRSCRLVALTYDAGSGADGAAAILDMLKRHDLKVTFFLTGKWAERYPELAGRIAAEGHEIGNHTYSHPDLTKVADDEVIRQVKDGEAAIKKATGKDPQPLFREPYGAFNEHERKLVRKAGYSYSIYWDVDTLDWQFPGVDILLSRIMKAQGGSIVLMHMNVADTAVASDKAIPQLQAKGYAIVPISRLLQCQKP